MPDQDNEQLPATEQEAQNKEETNTEAKPKPKLGNAAAYSQGTDIHIAPGQETQLPSETMHTPAK